MTGKMRSKAKLITVMLAVMMVVGVAGGTFAWQGDGFKGENCSAIGGLLEDLSPELREQVENAFTRFRDKLKQLRAEFHGMEAPRKEYREDFHQKREEAREELLNELPSEVEEGLREWRENNARENFNGSGGMKRNQQFEGSRGGGGRRIHHETNREIYQKNIQETSWV